MVTKEKNVLLRNMKKQNTSLDRLKSWLHVGILVAKEKHWLLRKILKNAL